ncbi:TonB-dependent receptor [Gemmatirosa kalamazoonensis]|nr:carboxypeptidase regulatory-like domain-containing protein [Gemmatirosa kalamazoonensis]
MMIRRIATFTAALVAVVSVGGSRLGAQATTGSVGGRVTGANGEPLEAAQVQVVDAATGRTSGAATRTDGRYVVLGLEPGNNYRVTFRRIGYAPQTVQPVTVSLGQTTPVDMQLHTQATQLSTVTVQASGENSIITPTRTGAQTTITDTLIRKLPTLNRSFTDFVSLTPQVSTNGPGLSAGGVNNRFNNIQIDGATEKDLFGLGSTGQPGGQAGGKSIGIESVKEYQVLLAPFDVRVGQFAGLSINAITKSGTNQFHGSAYAYGRNQQFQRSQPYLNDFKQAQYGFSAGGPIVKDKVFFFVNPEWQQQAVPASGPVLGDPTIRLTQTQIDQFTKALSDRGITELGTAGFVNRHNPLTNIFARVDFVLPFNTTLIVRENYAHAEQDVFSRSSTGAAPFFPLSSSLYHFVSDKHAPVAQLRTNFSNGAYNELIVGYTRIRDARETPGRLQAQVLATIPSVVQLAAGTDASSQANALDQDTWELTDNYTLPLPAGHRLTIGTQNQFYKARNVFGANSAGLWTFGTLDSLIAGLPNRYQIGVPVTGDGSVRPHAQQLSAYVQDDWTATDRLNLTLGVRADLPRFTNRPPFNAQVQQQFNVNTSEIPTGNLQISPRFGFNYNITGDLRNVVRGGLGLFQGAPAYVWLSNAFQNSGGVSGFASLSCNAATAPQFTAANVASPPRACTNGTQATAGAEVDLLDPDMKFPQTLKGDLAFDRAIGQGYVLTLEGLYTKSINDLLYYNAALQDAPIASAVDGRSLYGLQPGSPSLKVTGRNAVYAVQNYSKAYAYNLTGKLEKRFRNNFGGAVAYTYSEAKDVVSLTSSTAGSQYRFGRVYAGSQRDASLAPSAFETKHRIVANGSYTVPKTRTSLSFIYSGSSGVNYAYVSNTDLNGDNQTQNDPVYVPSGPSDPKTPTFVTLNTTDANGAPVSYTPQQQSDAFFAFIDKVDCLRESKGRILGRNSCTTPWINQTDISIEQALPTFHGQNVSIRLDGINFMNFLNKNWGRQVTTSQFNPQVLYSPTAMVLPGTNTTANLQTGVPRITFNPTTQQFNYNNVFSNYTFQLSVRYSF